jgi:hypothetical protein
MTKKVKGSNDDNDHGKAHGFFDRMFNGDSSAVFRGDVAGAGEGGFRFGSGRDGYRRVKIRGTNNCGGATASACRKSRRQGRP